MKKVLSIIMLFVFVIALVGCSSKPDEISSEDNTSSVLESGIVGNTLEVDGLSVTLFYASFHRNSALIALGHEYVIVEIEIYNNNDSEVYFSAVDSFNAYIDGNFVPFSQDAVLYGDNSRLPVLEGTVASEQGITGILGFEISDDWEKIEIEIIAINNNDNESFTITRPDIETIQ